MRTELTQELLVDRFAVFAEMAWMEDRPELGVICRLARESAGRISPAVIQRALPGLPDQGAANIVRRCEELDLCDRSGSLTALGEDVAETDRAPVPEQGVYDVWAVSHPLLGARMLHVERLTPSRNSRFDVDSVGPLPIEPRHGAVFTSVVNPRQRFLLRSLPSAHGRPGVVGRNTNAQCRVRWVLDWSRETNEVRLDGALDTAAGRRPFTHEPEHVEIDLWCLMDDWRLGPLRDHGEWHGDQQRRLAVTFDGLTAEQRDSFTKDLDLGDVDVTGFGRWSGARLSKVPIGPATSADAAEWALARLNRRLTESEERRTRGDARRLFAEVTEDTPLAPYRPTLPKHDALLARYEKDPATYWRLAAPVDLAPFTVGPAELGPMTIGEPASGAVPPAGDDASRILVPYRGGWSMQMLVERLTRGDETRHLLLVDRYVWGRDNLTTLELLVKALAWSGAPAVQIWTGDEARDQTIAEIRRITGVQPQRYRDVFVGSGRPHDRYMVVVPAHGAPYGWQMSNSPLHARVDHGEAPTPMTPLRWRDLTATRLNVSQLWGPIASWAGERTR